MRIKMFDGRTYSGRSYRQVVERMSRDKLTIPHSVDSYRKATAKRVADVYKVEVDSSTDATFVRSLVHAGLAEKVA